MGAPMPWEDYQGGFVNGDTDLGGNTSAPVPAPSVATSSAPSAAPAAGPWQDFGSPSEQAQPTTDMEAHFGDDMPAQSATRMAPEDEAHLQSLYKTGSPAEIMAFQHSKGFSTDPKLLSAYIAARDAGHAGDDSVKYSLAPAPDQGRLAAFSNALSQGASLGGSDELHGLINGISSLAHGGGYLDAYNRTVDQDRAQLGADEENHGALSLAGNLIGGLAVPLGLEKAGLTSSVRAVGLAARDAAIAEGIAPAAADRIATRAIAHRLATEGATYNGIYSAASSEGDPSQRLLAGATGAAGGALIGGVAIPALSRAGGVIGRTARRGFDAVTESFTSAGANRKAAGVLSDNTLRPIEDVVNDIAKRPEAVPGSKPTLGEVAGDAGLAGLQRGVANSSTAAGPIGERMAQNAMARTAYADEALGAGNPQAIQDVGASRVGDAESATAEQQASRAATAEPTYSELAGRDCGRPRRR